MKQYQIKIYNSSDFALWNGFIDKAKNATFLFHRHFMDYHNDRFEDFSLMVFDNEKLAAILPANKVGDIIFSHQGLTYGGLVLPEKAKLGDVIEMMKSVLQFLNENKIKTLQVKVIPSIYNSFFSDEIEHIIFLLKAKIIRKDVLSVIDLTTPFFITKTRNESINRGKKNNLIK